jgi:uncharacterized Zn finger protein (UPF0148 family)
MTCEHCKIETQWLNSNKVCPHCLAQKTIVDAQKRAEEIRKQATERIADLVRKGSERNKQIKEEMARVRSNTQREIESMLQDRSDSRDGSGAAPKAPSEGRSGARGGRP